MAFIEDKFWLNKDNCYWNVLYHTKHHNNKKNHTQRLGIIYYKGEQIAGGGNDLDISTRLYYNGGGHTWTETNDGFVIDWVINDKLNIPSSEKVKWSKTELTELGFEYKYYKNEIGIKKKVEKSFYCNCKLKTRNPDRPCPVDWAKHFWSYCDI